MEKEYNLQCVDYAIEKTIERAAEDPSLKQLASATHLTNAIREYMFNNSARGFSSKDNGRDYIKQMTPTDFQEIIIKHVFKSKNAKNRLGYAQLLSINKGFSENLTNDEVQELIYKSFREMNVEGIVYLLNKYPNLYKSLISQFIEERYFDASLGANNLDVDMISQEDTYYYKQIDNYYNSLRNNLGSSGRR